MNYESILKDIQKEIKPLFKEGKIADYIPALAKINPNQFAMSLQLFDGTTYNIGDVETKFSIQSISKVFTFTMALHLYGKNLFRSLYIYIYIYI